ncbi:MAG: hypothetical protein RLZZ519_1096 [Bacteroidota bacterium]|jgi:hypothetical protein
MKFEVAIAIAIGWFIFRTISKAIRKNKANVQTGAQNSTNSPNTAQEIIDQAAAERVSLVEEYRSKEGNSLEREIQVPAQRILDPFMEATTLEDNTTSHYNEESLLEEYNRTHDRGKTVGHHKHKLFDLQNDRNKSSHIQRGGGQAKSHGAGSYRTERKVKKSHPIANSLKTMGGRKQAVILSEILKRPEF